LKVVGSATAVPLLGSDLGQVHTTRASSPSSINRYRSKGGDALRLGW